MKHLKRLLVVLFSFFLAFIVTSCDDSCEHEFKVTNVVAPTCLSDGYTISKCEKCETYQQSNYVNAKGHQLVTTKEGRDATCTTSGLTAEKVCSACNVTVQEQNGILPLGHSYNPWQIETMPTIYSQGMIIRTCIRDNKHVEKHILPALSTVDYVTSTVASTCSVQGYIKYSYSLGGEKFEFQRPLELKDHEYTKRIVEPTCTIEGYTIYECVCGYNYTTNIVPALGHTYTSTTTAPTCTTQGFTTYSCLCGHSYNDNFVDALEHDYETWKVDAEPTELERGSISKGCLRDETHIQTKGLPVLNEYDYDYTYTAPTCSNEGVKQYAYEYEGTKFIFKITIDKVPHNPINYIDDGEKHKVICEFGCEYLLDHEYEEFVVTKAPTCNEFGEKTSQCILCHKEYVENVSKLSHTPIAVEKVDPTCTRVGYTAGSKCSVCNEYVVKPEEVAMLKHTYVDGKCSSCGEIFDLTVTYMDGDKRYEIKHVSYKDPFDVIVLEGSEHKVFDGWYNETFSVKYERSYEIVESIVVYAKWTTSIGISTKEELLAITSGNSYHLENDINLNGATWVPLENYNGVFDGNGYTIKNFNLTINTGNTSANYSLFGQNNGTIKNLTIKDMAYSVTASSYKSNNLAIVAGSNTGLIDNVKIVTSQVTCILTTNSGSSNSTYFGYICGTNTGRVNNCNVELDGKFTINNTREANENNNLYSHLGGIVGLNTNNGEITNSYYKGTFNASLASDGHASWGNHYHSHTTIYIGGLVATNNKNAVIKTSNTNVVINCSTSSLGSDSTQYGYFGGLVAMNTDTALLQENFALSTLRASLSHNIHVGGLVGRNTGNASIKSCYASTDMVATTSSGSNFGGFVGTNTSLIQNSYVTGTINGTVSTIIGGFVGTSSAGTISKCYTGCHVTASAGTSNVFVATGIGTIAKCYYLDTVEYKPGTSVNGTLSQTVEIAQKGLMDLLDGDFLKDDLYWDNEGWYIDSDDLPFLNWEFNTLHNYQYEDGEIIEPTCTTAGFTQFVCTDEHCGKVFLTDIKPALGHTPSESSIIKLPTHSETGKISHKCSTCAETYEEVINALGHEIPEEITCDLITQDVDGLWYYTCKGIVCENKDHTEDTCTCERVCNEKIEINYNEVVHLDVKHFDYVASQCGEYDFDNQLWIKEAVSGTTEGYKCMACERILQGMLEVAPHFFNEDETVQIKPATCLEEGLLQKTCTTETCKAVVDVIIPATGHTFQNGSLKCKDCAAEICNIDETYKEITTAKQLFEMDTYGKYYLANDIDLKDVVVNPIGTKAVPFYGTLIGNGYKIKNLELIYDEESKTTVSGLFAYNSGILAKVVIENATIYVENYNNMTIGILTGVNKGIIYDCDVVGNIDIVLHASAINSKTNSLTKNFAYTYGGISAINEKEGTIQSCSITGTMSYVHEINSIFDPSGFKEALKELINTGEMRVNVNITAGGISGINRGLILDTIFNPAVHKSAHISSDVGGTDRGKAYVYLELFEGGFVGFNSGTIESCSSVRISNSYHTNKDDCYEIISKKEIASVIVKLKYIKITDMSMFEEYPGYIGNTTRSSKISSFTLTK